MESFTIAEGTDYVCIGPAATALLAAEQLVSGDHPSPWWSAPPASHCGGTVLVHDVDYRIPAHSGQWYAGHLYNRNVECGAMIWHESVGDVSGACQLLREMENAGAPVICNQETPAVREQGVYFIGRYSWENNARDKKDRDDLSWYLYNGPDCFFASPTAMQENFSPQKEAKLELLRARKEELLSAKEAEMVNLPPEEQEKQRSPYAIESLLFEKLWGSKEFLLPPVMNLEQGIGYIFSGHEYLFGRLWFQPLPNNSIIKCRAFCFYTYHSPDFFAQMKLLNQPIIPYFPIHFEPDRRGNYFLQFAKYLSEHEQTLECSIEELFQQLTFPFVESFFQTISTPAIEEDSTYRMRFVTPGILEAVISEPFFTSLFRRGAEDYVKVNEDILLAILMVTPQTIVEDAGRKQQDRFHDISNQLREGSYAFNSFDFESSRACHLANHFHRPKLFEKLLEYNFPIISVLSLRDTYEHGWFRTMFADACYNGKVEVVMMLLNAAEHRGLLKQMVDERVEGDGWDAIVYAKAGGHQEVLDALKNKLPDHPTWTRADIPLKMKCYPNISIFPKKDPVPPPAPSDKEEHAVGTLANIQAITAPPPTSGFFQSPVVMQSFP